MNEYHDIKYYSCMSIMNDDDDLEEQEFIIV